MVSDEEGTQESRGAEFRLPDGTIEIVFETAEGRVLTVREYPSRKAFRRAVAEGEYCGENEEVKRLPDVDSFTTW